MFVKIIKYYKYDKVSFNQEEIKQIFEKFKENFIKCKEEKEKEKEKEKENEKSTPNENDKNIDNNDYDFDNLSLNDKINILKRFLKEIINIYDNENEICIFLLENLNYLELNNKNLINCFKESEELESLIEPILSDIEKNKKMPFDKIEDLILYKNSLIQINYIKLNLYYTIKNDDIDRIILIQKISNLVHLDKFFVLFTIQNKEEIINEMIKFLFKLYTKNNIELLYKRIKDNFNFPHYSNIIKLYEYTIDALEKEYVLKIKAHSSLCKKRIISIKYDINEKEKIEFNFYGNTTINEIYDYLNKAYKSEKEYFIIFLKSEKDKKNILLDNSFSNKTLNELKNKREEIIIDKKPLIRDKLYENGNLTESFKKLLKKWFYNFSKGKEEMDRNEIAECINELTCKQENKFEGNSIKVIIFLKKYSDNYDNIKEDKFIKFYLEICKENEENKMNDVWNNIKNMHYRIDLTEIPQIRPNNLLPRYYLSNKTEKYEELYLIDLLNEKYKKSLDEELFDFLSFLSTNEEIYNNVLNKFNSDENMKFTKKMDEYINNLYTLIIIESIIEDVEILNNDKLPKANISLEEYNPFYKKENNELKNKFFIEFIDKNYSDVIDYASKIFEMLNKEENYEPKNHNLIMRCCSKCLDIINNIYIPFYNIKFLKDEDNKNNIKYESLKNIIQDKKLENKLSESSIYNNIVYQILLFIDKYYNKYDNENEGKGIISILIQNSYLLLFSLFYASNLFDNIQKDKDNEKKKVLLEKIIKNIFINKKNIQYIRLLFFNIFKSKIEINSAFLSYLVKLTFTIFKDEYIFGDKQKIGMYISYLKFLLTYIANKEELNNLMKDKILEHYNILFNHIGSKTPEGKINESALITIIQTYNKFLEELKPDNHPLKNEIINKFKDEMSLFDSYINKLVSKEKDNITKNNQKISDIEKLFNEDKEKIISEENVNKILNEVNQDKKDPKNKDTNAIDTIVMQYGLLCVNSDKFDIKDKIKLLISELTKIKEKEQKLFFENNSSKSSKDKNILKNLKSDRIKKKSNYIGIRNLGTICYLNSVIQQLYMIPQFKYSIMGVDDKKEPQKSEYLKDDNMLHQLQKLFTYLTYTSYGEVIPKELAFSIKNYEGQPINTNEMQDSNEFYLNFCDNIEESLKKTKYEYLIKNLFIGKLCNKKICTSCKNITYSFEDFKDITLDVKDLNNIYESLDKYISEDNIEDYHC